MCGFVRCVCGFVCGVCGCVRRVWLWVCGVVACVGVVGVGGSVCGSACV